MIKELSLMGLLIVTILSVGGMDREDAEQDQSTYCEMVAIWESDPRPVQDRAGWPPYDSTIKCEGE